jgi:hypothetical protein
VKDGEALDVSEGACTGRNFPARRFGVKQHGVILGMQMQCNRGSFYGTADAACPHPDPPPASGRGSSAAQFPLVNAFLTINRAKIAQ